jgi:hypothetical protein
VTAPKRVTLRRRRKRSGTKSAVEVNEMAALRPGPGVGTHRTMSAPPTERGQSLTERESEAREASLATAREAARLLAVRIARDKGTGRPASWFEGRREDQPFCGLTNEGATCYLNSLIQALFLLPEVRREVFAFSYEGEAVHGPADACVPLQLARLFTQLQLTSCQAVSTRSLTASFGWSRAESFRQHDVQELCRVLFTALAKYGVAIERELFEGMLTSTLRCLKY